MKRLLFVLVMVAGALSAEAVLPKCEAGKPIKAAVVMSEKSVSSPAWRAVADALVKKYDARGFVVIRTNTQDAQAVLSMTRPTYAAFVCTPEEVNFQSIVALHHRMRTLDKDPYEDVIWGVVTGPTAKDALRVAQAGKPDLTRALTTTGTNEGKFQELVSLLDAQPVGTVVRKNQAGEVTKEVIHGDLSHVFATAWKELDPGVIVTSSHASERNLEMPFSKGNIIPKKGAFWTCPHAQLINYMTGQAKVEEDAQGVDRLAEPKTEKIWIAPGNCLIANHLDDRTMVMTALGFGKCNQFMGYMVTTWYGAVGWGTYGKWMGGNKTLGEAYHAQVNETIEKLQAICPNAFEFKLTAPTSVEYTKSFGPTLQGFLQTKAKFADPAKLPERMRDLMGLFWDRDTTVLYGDPALESSL